MSAAGLSESPAADAPSSETAMMATRLSVSIMPLLYLPTVRLSTDRLTLIGYAARFVFRHAVASGFVTLDEPRNRDEPRNPNRSTAIGHSALA